MANIQYIGARYVPKLFDNPDDHSSAWKSGISYEPLVIVTYLDNSYTSRKPVPATVGNPSDNSNYWARTGDYNAAVANLQNSVDALAALVGDEDLVSYYNSVTDALVKLSNFVSPEMFGAYGDGTHNDTTALKNCIRYALEHNMGITAKNGAVYLCNDTLTINNNLFEFYPFIMMFNNAQIKFTENVSTCIEFILAGLKPQRHHIIDGLNIICGDNSTTGILIGECNQIEFNNCIVNNVNAGTGIKLNGASFEINFNNCIVQGNNISTSIGFDLEASSTDNVLYNCRPINCQKGFIVKSPGNMFIACHPWIVVGDAHVGSVAFDNQVIHNAYISCHSDNFEVAFKTTEPYIIIDSCRCYTTYKNTDNPNIPVFLDIPNFYISGYRRAIVANNTIRFASTASSGFAVRGYFLKQDPDVKKFFGGVANNIMYEMDVDPNRIDFDITPYISNDCTVVRNTSFIQGDICHLQCGLYFEDGITPETDVIALTLPAYAMPTKAMMSTVTVRPSEYSVYITPAHCFISATSGNVTISLPITESSQKYVYFDLAINIKGVS